MATDGVNGVNGVAAGNPDDFVDKILTFPDSNTYERIRPITDLRKDPGEGRILYICNRQPPDAELGSISHSAMEKLVLKVKAQWPGPQNLIYDGPSPMTSAELNALQKFRDESISHVPHLLTWKKATQGPNGIHPGGYIVYTVMTRVPGASLWDLGYWSMEFSKRAEIQQIFLKKLREIRELGIAPYDCALRNVLWDEQSKQVGIVDFEHYRETTEPIENEKEELQRWGLVQRPPPGTWHTEWFMHQ